MSEICSDGDLKLLRIPLNDGGRYFRIMRGDKTLSRWADLTLAIQEYDKQRGV